jgi:hypothetical protein
MTTSKGIHKRHTFEKINDISRSYHPLYFSWYDMLRRCHNSKHSKYKDYGGRGIFVCKRWHTFSNFVDDMEHTFKSGLTIERKNNDRGYRPSNCKWATMLEQSRNHRFMPNKTGHRGIYHGPYSYMAYFYINNGRQYVGCFKTLNQAVRARAKALRLANV